MIKTTFISILLGVFIVSCQNKTDISEKPTGGGDTLLTGKQEEAAERKELKTFSEKFCGYYFYADYLNDIIIIKSSLDDESNYLILQEFFFVNDETIEGEMFVLDNVEYSDWRILFKNSADAGEYYAGRIYVEYRFSPEEMTMGFHDGNSLYNKIFIRSGKNFFVKTRGEIANVVQSRFSYEAQKKYTGKFTFRECEYMEIVNMENPLDKAEANEIIIDIKNNEENAWLVAKHVRGNETFNMGAFIVRDNEKFIHFDSSGGASWGYDYRFLDEDTIAHQYYSSGEDAMLRYKFIYKKTEAF